MISFDSDKKYSIKVVAKKIDRVPLTIKKWEKYGLIPRAKRDGRGYRYYTEKDIQKIEDAAKEIAKKNREGKRIYPKAQ